MGCPVEIGLGERRRRKAERQLCDRGVDAAIDRFGEPVERVGRLLRGKSGSGGIDREWPPGSRFAPGGQRDGLRHPFTCSKESILRLRAAHALSCSYRTQSRLSRLHEIKGSAPRWLCQLAKPSGALIDFPQSAFRSRG